VIKLLFNRKKKEKEKGLIEPPRFSEGINRP